MYTTVDEVQDITATEVTQAHVQLSHYIMEMYTGRPESRVEDSDDLYLLKLATAYQAAYVRQNTEIVFEQIPFETLQLDKYRIKMKENETPFIAPLAVMACERLSWFRSRSVSTAPYWHAHRYEPAWRAD